MRAYFQSEGRFYLAFFLDVRCDVKKKKDIMILWTGPSILWMLVLIHEPPDGNRKSVSIGYNL